MKKRKEERKEEEEEEEEKKCMELGFCMELFVYGSLCLCDFEHGKV